MLNVCVDYHKAYSYITVVDDDGSVKKEGRVGNHPDELARFMAGFSDEPSRAVMEGTRNWTLMYDMLEQIVDEAKLAHPLKVNAIAEARIKTDKIDAGTLLLTIRSSCLRSWMRWR